MMPPETMTTVMIRSPATSRPYRSVVTAAKMARKPRYHSSTKPKPLTPLASRSTSSQHRQNELIMEPTSRP